jgi:hypothetical protein
VTAGRLLADDEFIPAVLAFDHTAFRLELQAAYAEPEEDALYAAFLRGEAESPAGVPELQDWYAAIADRVARGARVERVRVQQRPPTDYQRFERWLERWNIQAGEIMRYTTRERAYETGLLPAAGNDDWWLLDSSRLVVMQFGAGGRRTRNVLVTEPVTVLRACAWRDLAVHHSDRAHLSDVAA